MISWLYMAACIRTCAVKLNRIFLAVIKICNSQKIPSACHVAILKILNVYLIFVHFHVKNSLYVFLRGRLDCFIAGYFGLPSSSRQYNITLNVR